LLDVPMRGPGRVRLHHRRCFPYFPYFRHSSEFSAPESDRADPASLCRSESVKSNFPVSLPRQTFVRRWMAGRVPSSRFITMLGRGQTSGGLPRGRQISRGDGQLGSIWKVSKPMGNDEDNGGGRSNRPCARRSTRVAVDCRDPDDE
jgi:hypothetical protein